MLCTMSGGELSRLQERRTADLDPAMASIQQPPPPRQQTCHQPKSHQEEEAAHQQQHRSSAETTSRNDTVQGATYGKTVEPADDFPVGLRILVVDDDPTCLAVLQKMLQQCSYQVTTCGRATKALELLREDKDKFDLVISDVYMPDMDGFKLLELVGLEMDLPVIMMSGNGETSAVMKGIIHGACDYLLKPVRLEELRNIWQHVVRRLRSEPKELSASFEDGERLKRGGAEDANNVSLAADTIDGIWRNKKKKEAKEDDEDYGQDNDDPSALKKPRVVWLVELHQQFVSAVNQLGIDKAVPKRILELMSVHGLTRENVASHLQKYRLYLKRLSGVTTQSDNLSASFAGPDIEYGGLIGLDEMDLRTLVTNGHLPPQTIAALHHANMAGRLGLSSGMVGLSSPLDPSVLAQIAAVQSVPMPRPLMDGTLLGNQAGFQSLSGALDYNPLRKSHPLPEVGHLGQPDDLPSLKVIHQLGMGSLGVSNRNLMGGPSEELTTHLLHQRAHQQSGGSTVTNAQATGILRNLSSDLNLDQAGSMPNLPGNAINLSNMCTSVREFDRSSSLSNTSGSAMQSSIAEAQNLIGSSVPSGCSFQASVLSLKNGGLEDLSPTKRMRMTYSPLSHLSPGIGPSMAQSGQPAWLGSQGVLGHRELEHGLKSVYSLHQVSSPSQNFAGGVGSPGQPACMGSMGMNFPSSLALDGGAARPSLNCGQSLNEQGTVNSEHTVVKEEQVRDNFMCSKFGGGLMSNESSEELLNYYSMKQQSHDRMGFLEADLVNDSYPLDNLYVK